MRAAIALFLTFLLVGCSPVSLDTEDLMRPPQLSETQSLIYDALLAALGTSSSNVALRYPRSGDYRSAFIFRDLDGDGIEEVLAFYSLEASPDELNINVMQQREERWVSVYDTPGGTLGVESVDFVSLTNEDELDIVIGWGDGSQQVNQISVLRFEEDIMHTLYQGRYTEYVTSDFDGDGLEELMTVSLSSTGGKPYATLMVNESGVLVESRSIQLNLEMTDFAQIIAGAITPEYRGILVEGWIGEDTLATDVILVGDRSTSLAFEGGSEFYEETIRRSLEVLSDDVNSDGLPDIPIQTLAPEHDSSENSHYYTTYCSLTENFELQPVSTAYINEPQGYTFYLPEYWVEHTAVSTDDSSGELRFWEYDPDTEQTGQELLRIRAYSIKDYQDRFDLEQYQQIGQKGNFIYDVYLLAPTTGDYALTQTELENLFNIH